MAGIREKGEKMKTYEFNGAENHNRLVYAARKLRNMAYDAESEADYEKSTYIWREYLALRDFLDDYGSTSTHELTIGKLAYAKSVCAWTTECKMKACIDSGREDLLKNCL